MNVLYDFHITTLDKEFAEEKKGKMSSENEWINLFLKYECTGKHLAIQG